MSAVTRVGGGVDDARLGGRGWVGGRGQIGGMSGLQTLMKSMNSMDMSSFMGLPE